MASLLQGSNLNAALENIIIEAESYIVFMCPYFKLHEKLKDCLKHKKNNPDIQIIVIFGKNENDPSKSLNKDDFEFLKSFPKVTIAYEKRLHAKYFANEKSGLVTSINLHSYSLDNNIEVGVEFKTKNVLKAFTDKALNPLTSLVSDTENIAAESERFFQDIFENADKVFEKLPKYESKYMGLTKKYVGSEILKDDSSKFFNQVNNPFEKQSFKSAFGTNENERTNSYNNSSSSNQWKNNSQKTGFCIRTREAISFDPSKPLSKEAYYVWAEFSNPDYSERYCHSCGKEWRTTVRRPLCNACD
jgi:hypothetical protein